MRVTFLYYCIRVFTFILFFFSDVIMSQTSKLSIDDQLLQQEILKENKLKVLNYSMKDFDSLFMEFFTKKLDPNVVLTKEEFYTYTVKIAAFSDRLASLYPEQKEVAVQNKEKWLSENYEDYLLLKATQKK